MVSNRRFAIVPSFVPTPDHLLCGHLGNQSATRRRGDGAYTGFVADSPPNHIVCPLWDESDRRFRARHYHAWDTRCGSCGRRVAVSEAVKRSIDADRAVPVICEQCDLLKPDEPALPVPRWVGPQGCELCEKLAKQVDEARLGWCALENSPDRKAAAKARRKWSHLLTTVHDHRHG